MSNPDDEFQLSRASAFIEQARNKELARQLAAMQEDIVRKLIAFSEQDPERFEYIGGCRDEELLLFFLRETFQGISEVSVDLEHSFLGGGTFRAKVGVDTPTTLNLGLHTDRETWESVRQTVDRELNPTS